MCDVLTLYDVVMGASRRMVGKHWAEESPAVRGSARRRKAQGRRARGKSGPDQGQTRILQRSLAVLCSVLALAVTGLGFKLFPDFVRGGGILGPKSPPGAINILLIGLDSRKDQDGNDLPAATLRQLHAGDGQEGGYNTNTLILIHVPTGGKAIAFSIPRDDYVAVRGIKGYTKIKIKEAYGLKKFEVEQELAAKGVTDRKRMEREGREAGRQATIRTVRDLLGVPIDQYAEVNLVGFYDVAKALGGIDVCLNHAVYDDYSGANFPAGRQTLAAAEALAFVRQRHGLENGDLDRTHRQQAFLAGVKHKLSASGKLSDLGELRSLVSVMEKDVVLSPGWDVVGFIQQNTGGEVEFRTLPVERYESINEQDVNIIDPKKVAAEVQQAFGGAHAGPAPKPAATPRTEQKGVEETGSSGATRPAASDEKPPAPDRGSPVASGGIPCVD